MSLFKKGPGPHWTMVENSERDLPKAGGYYWIVTQETGLATQLMEYVKNDTFSYSRCVVEGMIYGDIRHVGIVAWTPAEVPAFKPLSGGV